MAESSHMLPLILILPLPKRNTFCCIAMFHYYILVSWYWNWSLNSSFITASFLPYLFMLLCLVSRKLSRVPEMKTTSPRPEAASLRRWLWRPGIRTQKPQVLEESLFWYLSKKEIPGATCQPWRGKKRIIILTKDGILGEGETVYKPVSCARFAGQRGCIVAPWRRLSVVCDLAYLGAAVEWLTVNRIPN